ncbi:MAG: hypothetical protein LBS62_04690 [Clostridiales bacterium]|jgi:hypothetical protein|nr:hypothetical protein [Clostridiales bacterium]
MKNNTVETTEESERYMDSMHRLGRAGMLGAIVIMLAVPTLLGIYFDALPSVGQIFTAALPLLLIFAPSSLFEVISYTPLLGSSIYLTLITGEVLNLKLPAANNAIKAMDVELGTEESDVVASIAVGTAYFVTIAIVTVGVVLVMPLQGILTLPAVKTASANILPALFGAMCVGMFSSELNGGIRASGHLKGCVPPAALMTAVTLLDPQISALLRLDVLVGQEGTGVIISHFQSFMIIVVLPVAYFSTKWLYQRGKIKIRLPADQG